MRVFFDCIDYRESSGEAPVPRRERFRQTTVAVSSHFACG